MWVMKPELVSWFHWCHFIFVCLPYGKNVCSPKKPRKPRNELNGGWLVGNTLWFNMVSNDSDTMVFYPNIIPLIWLLIWFLGMICWDNDGKILGY